jgi:chemotaxis protein MotB
MADDKPIIIIKKKGGHGGHHGGAWKVAYADFVTAMMAFFMVMWLVNTADQQTKQNIASYFRRPGLFQSGSGTPLMIGEAGILPDAYVPPHPQDTKKAGGKDQDTNLPKNAGNEDQKDKKKQITIKGEEGKRGGQKDAKGKSGLQKDDAKNQGQLSEGKAAAEMQAAAAEKLLFDKVAQQIREEVASSKELQDLLGVVDVKIDADGLNIEVMDSEKTSMFASGSARISNDAQKAFEKIGEIIKKLPYSVDIVGHTDAKPFSSRTGGYSNWELSADRANAARRLLESEGIEATRITSVVGRADKELRVASEPMAASNRRITLKMRFKFNRNLNFEKNPELLENPEAMPELPTGEGGSAQVSGGAEPDGAPEKVHSMTTKQVAANDHYVPKKSVAATERSDLVQLPESGAPNTPAGKNKLFGDSPVIAPADPFSNF